MAIRHWFDTVDSTQRKAIALARAGAEPGTRVVAARQTHGVGRADHTWSSPPGGLYLSIVLPTPAPERDALVPLAIGAELRRTLHERYGVATVLRWPNDLLTVEGGRWRKLAGVLVDQVFSVEHGPAIVAGIGVNVRPDPARFPPEIRDRVATLAGLCPAAPSVADVEPWAVASAEVAVRRLTSEAGCRSVVSECREGIYGRGQRAWVDGRLAGRIRDLADDGSLRLEGERGTIGVRAGTVTVEETP